MFLECKHNIICCMHDHDYTYTNAYKLIAVAYHDRDGGRDRTVHNMGDGKEGKVNNLIRLDQQVAYQYYELV